VHKRRVAFFWFLGLTASLVAGEPDRALSVLSATREALGGVQRLSTVRSFVATGRTRQIQGDNLVPIEFEIACELPNKYVRRDEFPARDIGPTRTGFSGATSILIPPPSAAPGLPPEQVTAAREARALIARQDFARLALGMFGASFDAYPLTFAYLAEAEAPEGKADVLEVRAAPAFVARLFILQATHLPVMVTWPAGAPGGRGPSPTSATDQRLYYGDYREVSGMKFPYRLRRATGANTTEETVFDQYRVNVRIDPKRFEANK
jgi:hypothetical protein